MESGMLGGRATGLDSCSRSRTQILLAQEGEVSKGPVLPIHLHIWVRKARRKLVSGAFLQPELV